MANELSGETKKLFDLIAWVGDFLKPVSNQCAYKDVFPMNTDQTLSDVDEVVKFVIEDSEVIL